MSWTTRSFGPAFRTNITTTTTTIIRQNKFYWISNRSGVAELIWIVTILQSSFDLRLHVHHIDCLLTSFLIITSFWRLLIQLKSVIISLLKRLSDDWLTGHFMVSQVMAWSVHALRISRKIWMNCFDLFVQELTHSQVDLSVLTSSLSDWPQAGWFCILSGYW